jgi:hypothetical protein
VFHFFANILKSGAAAIELERDWSGYEQDGNMVLKPIIS